MSLFGLLGGEAKERAQDYLAKRRLEKKLGRKVADHELYSLSSHIEAEENAPRTEPQAQPMQFPQGQFTQQQFQPGQIAMGSVQPKSLKRKVLVFGILAGIAFLLVGGFFVISMSETTYNRLNPFTPKPPAGAFPATIAGYSLSEEPMYKSYRSYCECYGFTAKYKKGNESIYYNLYDFKTPGNAKKHLDNRYFIGGVPRIAEQTESRQVIIDSEHGNATIQFVAGKLLIYFGHSKPNEAINFENNLPYAALGMAQPPQRSADNLKEQPVEALTILEEFNRDRKAAETKYHAKLLLFSGTVAGTGKTEKGVPFIAIQKPGTKAGMDSVLSCSFVAGDAAKVAQLKNGETVQFRGKVNTKLPINMVIIEDCRIIE
jgi:hypothetical protein